MKLKATPFDRLTLRTAEPLDEVVARLRSAVATGRLFLRRPATPFQGTVTGRHFKIVRAQGIFERDESEPVLVGDILPTNEGTEVRVTMRPRMSAAVAPVVWLFMLAIWMPAGWSKHPKAAVLAIAAVASLYAVSVAWFWFRASKARTLLCEQLGCCEVERTNRLVRSA